MQLSSRDPFDLRHSVPMSREEEHRCAVAYVKTRDPALAERLIVANMRMVVALAHHYCRSDDDLGDFVQEGNRGLLQAVDKYDPTRGIKFCSYAVWWIRAYMLKLTMSNWRLVKVGTTQAQRKLFFSLGKERDRMQREGGEVNSRTLAARLRVKESEVVAMLERFAASEMSLETPLRSLEADGLTLGDSLSDAFAPGPDRCVEEAEFSRVLRAKLEAFGATLQGREVQIFRKRLFNDEPVKLTALAASFGVTRERVRQLEGRALRELRTIAPSLALYLRA
jgi:RNA polymerase sigma-32 factor